MAEANFETRVRCAAAAGWWTTLIGVIWMMVGWCFWIALPHCPTLRRWVECMWGGVKIDDVLSTVWLFFGAFKIILFIFLLVSIFLTIWARRLKKAA